MTPVWLTHGYPSAVQPSSGAFIAVQARAMAARGAAPRIVSPVSWMPPGVASLSGKWRRIAQIPHEDQDGDIPVLRPRYFAHPRENAVGAPHRFMLSAVRRTCTSKPDVIHAHCGVPHGWVAMRLAQDWGVPYAVTVLGSDVNIFAQASSGARRRFSAAIQGAGAVFAVGSHLAAETERMTGRCPDILHYGVPDEWLTLPRDKPGARTRLGLPASGFVGLFVGQLSDAKGVRDLARGIARLDESRQSGNACWVFAGDGPLRPELERLPSCRLAGAIDHSSLRDYYDAADVLILPSYHEGMPTVVLEAGSRGTPVVATDVGSVRDAVNEDTGWLLRPGDDAGLSARLEDLIAAAPEELATRGERLYQTVANAYSAGGNAARILNRYAEMTAPSA